MRVQNANTAAPSGDPQFIGWCLHKEDLCCAKLCAFREKDRNFVAALLRAGLVDGDVISSRLRSIDAAPTTAPENARSWLLARLPG